jgi:hypothetical protein
MNTEFKLYMKSGNIIDIEVADQDNKINPYDFLIKNISTSKDVIDWYATKDNKLIRLKDVEAIEIIGD